MRKFYYFVWLWSALHCNGDDAVQQSCCAVIQVSGLGDTRGDGYYKLNGALDGRPLYHIDGGLNNNIWLYSNSQYMVIGERDVSTNPLYLDMNSRRSFLRVQISDALPHCPNDYATNDDWQMRTPLSTLWTTGHTAAVTCFEHAAAASSDETVRQAIIQDHFVNKDAYEVQAQTCCDNIVVSGTGSVDGVYSKLRDNDKVLLSNGKVVYKLRGGGKTFFMHNLEYFGIVNTKSGIVSKEYYKYLN